MSPAVMQNVGSSGKAGLLSSGEESRQCYPSPQFSSSLRVMASADLNQDGHSDLVVGAPGYSHPGRFQIGRVYIVYGNDLGLPPVDLDLDKEAHGILQGFQVRTPVTSFLSWGE